MMGSSALGDSGTLNRGYQERSSQLEVRRKVPGFYREESVSPPLLEFALGAQGDIRLVQSTGGVTKNRLGSCSPV
jgi:hypothetical protein